MERRRAEAYFELNTKRRLIRNVAACERKREGGWKIVDRFAPSGDLHGEGRRGGATHRRAEDGASSARRWPNFETVAKIFKRGQHTGDHRRGRCRANKLAPRSTRNIASIRAQSAIQNLIRPTDTRRRRERRRLLKSERVDRRSRRRNNSNEKHFENVSYGNTESYVYKNSVSNNDHTCNFDHRYTTIDIFHASTIIFRLVRSIFHFKIDREIRCKKTSVAPNFFDACTLISDISCYSPIFN